MRRGAYPKIGRRITISQGRGVNDASTIRGRIHNKFVVGPLGRSECVLHEAHKTVARMIEQANAAFSDLNGLLIPRFCEEGALARAASRRRS